MWWCGIAICAAKTPTRSARLWHASEPLSRVSDLYRAEKSTYCAYVEVPKGVCGCLFCFVGYQRWGSNETVGVETVIESQTISIRSPSLINQSQYQNHSNHKSH